MKPFSDNTNSLATSTNSQNALHFQEATQEQRRQVISLLSDHHLPINDITGHVKLYALLQGGMVVGSAGLEIYGTKGLLRSLSIDDSLKGKGWGRYINQQVEAIAQKEGIQELYLVTNTAEHFFSKLGYRAINRSEVAAEVAVSGQFNGICPSSAAIMVKAL